jgi:hypothetical protein
VEGSTKSSGTILDSARWRERAPAMDGKAQSLWERHFQAQRKTAPASTKSRFFQAKIRRAADPGQGIHRWLRGHCAA